MAYDLAFGRRTRRNWSRDSVPRSLVVVQKITMSDEVTFQMSPKEMAMLADLAETRMRADAGDKKARRKMAEFAKKVRVLEKKARKGDAEARRTLLVLRESGALQPVQSITMGMGLELVPNDNYRAAVYRQAMRRAGGKRPTTVDFYRAKSAVDGMMRKIGASLYLPGARRGRVTR